MTTATLTSVLVIALADDFVRALASFGLAMLFFLAGYEIDFGRIRGGPLRRAAGSWAVSLLLGLAVGVALAAVAGLGWVAGLVVGLALALVPAALVALLLVRGVPVSLAVRRDATRPRPVGVGAVRLHHLPLVVVITSLGVDETLLSPATAAGLVGAGDAVRADLPAAGAAAAAVSRAAARLTVRPARPAGPLVPLLVSCPAAGRAASAPPAGNRR
jgi:hypothetical protein